MLRETLERSNCFSFSEQWRNSTSNSKFNLWPSFYRSHGNSGGLEVRAALSRSKRGRSPLGKTTRWELSGNGGGMWQFFDDSDRLRHTEIVTGAQRHVRAEKKKKKKKIMKKLRLYWRNNQHGAVFLIGHNRAPAETSKSIGRLGEISPAAALWPLTDACGQFGFQEAQVRVCRSLAEKSAEKDGCRQTCFSAYFDPKSRERDQRRLCEQITGSDCSRLIWLRLFYRCSDLRVEREHDRWHDWCFR